MICPQCGRQVDDHVETCPFCGAGTRLRAGSIPAVSSEEGDKDTWTTVLTEGYSDFRDTVVDQVIAFDPSLFQDKTGSSSNRSARLASDRAGSSASAGLREPANAGSPAERQRPARDEDTWVLGAAPAPSGSSSVASSSADRYAPPSREPQRKQVSTAFAPVRQPASGRPSAAMPIAALPDSRDRRASTVMIAVIVALGVVAVVAIVIAVALALNSSGGASTASTSVSVTHSSSAAVASVGSDGESESSASSESSSRYEIKNEKGTDTAVTAVPQTGGAGNRGGSADSLTDADAYKLLVDAYDDAGGYDKQIVSCAAEFNNNYKAESKKTRSAKASAVSSLASEVKDAWDELKSIEMPFWSENYDAWGDLCTCYECLWRRIDVIDRAWTVSLGYDKPAEHEKEILAPLRAEQDGSGRDIYAAKFNSLYPTIQLNRP